MAALVRLAALALLVVALFAASPVDGKKKRWKPCARGSTRNYLKCCMKRWYRNSYDPSCPWDGRSCYYLPNKYFSQCCWGKDYWGVYDWACDPDWTPSDWWSCLAYAPGQQRDKCCYNRNPWSDRKACAAWTTGSCSKVSKKYRSACCAGKWPGSDWYCDRYYKPKPGSSCASVGPAAIDACCANKDPYTDKDACRPWLPYGDCRKVSPQWRPACCSNKPWDARGCSPDWWATSPAVSASFGSAAPTSSGPPPSCSGAGDPAKCCSALPDPASDDGCPQFKKGGNCGDLPEELRSQCCFSKGPAGSADASCTPVLEAVQLTPTQVIATADPIADGTATENQGGGTDSSEGDDEGACSEADYKCVAADVSLTTYCLGKAVTPCPPGYACVGGSASKPACEVTADPNSPAVVPPPECEGSLKCIDAASFCDNGTISTCADGFACTGDEGAAACTAAAAPAGGETAAVTCTDPDQSCIAGADGGASTSYCIGGAVIPCDTDTTCSGDAGSAQCMAVVAPEDAPPPVESCSQENYACIDGSTYCFAGEVVACDADTTCAGGEEETCKLPDVAPTTDGTPPPDVDGGDAGAAPAAAPEAGPTGDATGDVAPTGPTGEPASPPEAGPTGDATGDVAPTGPTGDATGDTDSTTTGAAPAPAPSAGPTGEVAPAGPVCSADACAKVEKGTRLVLSDTGTVPLTDPCDSATVKPAVPKCAELAISGKVKACGDLCYLEAELAGEKLYVLDKACSAPADAPPLLGLPGDAACPAPEEAPATDTTPPADGPPADEPPADGPPADEPPADGPPADEPPADGPPADEPPADGPPADEPPADGPPADEPPVDGPPADDPFADGPPADGPPADDPFA